MRNKNKLLLLIFILANNQLALCTSDSALPFYKNKKTIKKIILYGSSILGASFLSYSVLLPAWQKRHRVLSVQEEQFWTDIAQSLAPAFCYNPTIWLKQAQEKTKKAPSPIFNLKKANSCNNVQFVYKPLLIPIGKAAYQLDIPGLKKYVIDMRVQTDQSLLTMCKELIERITLALELIELAEKNEINQIKNETHQAIDNLLSPLMEYVSKSKLKSITELKSIKTH